MIDNDEFSFVFTLRASKIKSRYIGIFYLLISKTKINSINLC